MSLHQISKFSFTSRKGKLISENEKFVTTLHTSVTTFLHDSQSLKLPDRTDIYPEFNEKEINYYIFGPKTESYSKMEKKYSI